MTTKKSITVKKQEPNAVQKKIISIIKSRTARYIRESEKTESILDKYAEKFIDMVSKYRKKVNDLENKEKLTEKKVAIVDKQDDISKKKYDLIVNEIDKANFGCQTGNVKKIFAQLLDVKIESVVKKDPDLDSDFHIEIRDFNDKFLGESCDEVPSYSGVLFRVGLSNIGFMNYWVVNKENKNISVDGIKKYFKKGSNSFLYFADNTDNRDTFGTDPDDMFFSDYVYMRAATDEEIVDFVMKTKINLKEMFFLD